MDLKKVSAYITRKLGCAHPYKVSRILVLLNWLSKDKLGKELVPLKIKGFEAAFYVEGLKEVFEDKCFRKDDELKCFTYGCGALELPEEVTNLIDEVIDRVKGLSNDELNKLAVKDPRYKDLIKG